MSEEMYQYLYGIIASRANPNSGRDSSARMAYVACLWMLEYAHDENWEGLQYYDYDSVLAGEILKQMFSKKDQY